MENMSELLTGSHPALLLKPPTGGHFGNIVTAVYAAMIREIGKKGKESRFAKSERGKFERTKAD